MLHENPFYLSIGSDHAGYELKTKLYEYLKTTYKIIDRGTNSEQSVDYPDYAHKVALDVSTNDTKFGILLCGSGQGVNITANKNTLVRSALCWNEEVAKLSRQHNDANILALPARFLTFEQARTIVEAFLITEFEGGRHLKRIEKITSIIQQSSQN